MTINNRRRENQEIRRSRLRWTISRGKANASSKSLYSRRSQLYTFHTEEPTLCEYGAQEKIARDSRDSETEVTPEVNPEWRNPYDKLYLKQPEKGTR